MSHPTVLKFSNWNKLFDWYGQSNLGGGKPVKFTTLNLYDDRLCYILPSRTHGDLELVLSIPRKQLTAFQSHQQIQKYFCFKK